MAKIRFWRWQQTDELGMPCPTRFRLSDVERNGADDLEQHRWPLETWNSKPSATDSARGNPHSKVQRPGVYE